MQLARLEQERLERLAGAVAAARALASLSVLGAQQPAPVPPPRAPPPPCGAGFRRGRRSIEADKALACAALYASRSGPQDRIGPVMRR